MNGTVVRLVGEKGFGFITGSDGVEYFFHRTSVQGRDFSDLREGQAVTFDGGKGPKGPRAENVR